MHTSSRPRTRRTLAIGFLAAAIAVFGLPAAAFATTPPGRVDHRHHHRGGLAEEGDRDRDLRGGQGRLRHLFLTAPRRYRRPGRGPTAGHPPGRLRTGRPAQRLRAAHRRRRRHHRRDRRRVRRPERRVGPRRLPDRSTGCRRAPPPTAASRRSTRTAAPATRRPTPAGPARSPSTWTWSPRPARSCHILLVEADDNSIANLGAAVDRRSRWARSTCPTATAGTE